MDYNKTVFRDHATKRMQQRGITKEVVKCILTHANTKAHVGDGRIALSVGKCKLNALQKDGQISSQLADKVRGTCLLVANDSGSDKQQVITALHMRGRAGRLYRKSHRKSHHRKQSRRSNRSKQPVRKFRGF